MKKALKFLGAVLAALIIVVLIYVAYVFIDYYRLKDNIELTVEKPVAAGDWQTDDGAQETGDSQTLRQQVPTGKSSPLLRGTSASVLTRINIRFSWTEENTPAVSQKK